MAIVFAGLSALFGAWFTIIRGPHVTDAIFWLMTCGLAAFVTLAGFGGAGLMIWCLPRRE